MIPPSTLPTEAELLGRVRAGDTAAYAELYSRHHAPALGLARAVAGHSRAEDLVAEAFTRTLQLMLDGRGPVDAFRGYLFTAIRNTHFNTVRKDSRLVLVDDFSQLEDGEADPWPALVENQLVRNALATLPPRWQQVIQLTTVEEKPLEAVAEILGTSLGATAQLAFRAREGLRIAYLAQHAPEPSADECRRVVPQLARGARPGARARRRHVDAHVAECVPCQSARNEIQTVADAL